MFLYIIQKLFFHIKNTVSVKGQSMQYSFLALICTIGISLSLSVFATTSPKTIPTSVESPVLENMIDSKQDENWCAKNPEECRYKHDQARARAYERYERQKEADEQATYCDRHPGRCEKKRHEHDSKWCELHPIECDR